jgi:hypothetical protein
LVLVGHVVFPVPAGDDHLPPVAKSLRLLVEKVDVLAIVGVVTEGEVASDELHVAFLTGAVVVEHAFVVPLVLVSELPPFLAGHDDNQGYLTRREYPALSLQLSRAVPFAMELASDMDAAGLEHVGIFAPERRRCEPEDRTGDRTVSPKRHLSRILLRSTMRFSDGASGGEWAGQGSNTAANYGPVGPDPAPTQHAPARADARGGGHAST